VIAGQVRLPLCITVKPKELPSPASWPRGPGGGILGGMPVDFDLDRFVRAQEDVYENAVAELKAGRKRTHWMWFVFPQLAGLGRTATAQRYAIASIDEARAYLAHPVLGPRLTEVARVLLGVEGRSAEQIFGFPDDLKLRSSMTLFARAAADPEVFRGVLDRYYDGPDATTIELLAG
jgi:uncharacterized protein (DUF1810 family)